MNKIIRPHGSLINLFSSNNGNGDFDPLTYDANTVALWDGNDAESGASGTWVDKVGGYVLANGRNGASVSYPTRVSGGINGHNYLQMDENGAYISYAQCALPVRSQPSTQYLVVGSNSHIGNRYWFDDGVVATRNTIRCAAPSPNISYTNAGTGVTGITECTLTQFFIITIVKAVGVDASSITIDQGTPKTFTMTGGGVDDAGYTLNASTGLITFTSIESKWAYIIARDGADDTDTQKLFVDFLKARFAL